jgi:stage V sporulation protein B
MDNPELRKITLGSYYLILDQVVNYGLGALFWLLLAKVISTTVLGQIFLVNALILAVLGFAGYGAQVTIAKYTAEYNSKGTPGTSRRVFDLGFKIGILVSGAAALLFFIFSGEIATSIYHDRTLYSLMIVGMLAVLPMQTIMACFNGLYQGSHRMKYTMLTDMIYQLFRIVAAVVLVLSGLGGFGIILGFAAGSLMAVLVGYSLFARKLFAPITKREEKSLLHVAKFSGFNYLAIGMSTLGVQISYLMLGMQNFDSVALFGISSLISGIVGGIIMSLGKAILPTASENLEKSNKPALNAALNLTFRLSLVVSGFIYILLMIAPEHVLGLLSHEYTEAADVLRVLVLSSILASLSAFIYSILNGLGRPQSVARIAILSAVTAIAISISLIPILGVLGGAIGSLASAFVSLSIAAFYLHKERHIIQISYSNILRPVTAIASAISLGFYALMFTQNMTWVLLSSAIAYILLIKLQKAATIHEIRAALHQARLLVK